MQQLFTAILRDITERKETENQLMQQKEELEQFAYVVSHDLHEPLRKIRMSGDQLKEKSGDSLDDSGRDCLERILNAAERIKASIRDLLMLAQMTTQAQALRSVNLSEILQAVLSDLELRLKETGGQVKVENLPVIHAEPIQMR